MDKGNHGTSHFDQFLSSQESSVVNKFQQKYWKTKQTLIKVTGKKEDEHVVASDADLDAKLEVFHSVQRTCMELLKVIEQYQRRITFLSQEENELGRFLRSQGSEDKSRAGKIMQATGKALCFSSQQRLALRVPLSRLYQEVETFRYRAISDTWLTVNRMEQSRTEYRGALLWMKDVSQELDPDTHKQMEKFRKVQTQVRHTKTSFDKLKNDVCQKVELLGASRCNLLSHVLTTYQTTLLHFWEKTSHTMAAIHESFKGCHDISTLGGSDQGTKKKLKKKMKPKAEDEETRPSTDEMLISIEEENHSRTYTQTGEDECFSSSQEKDMLSLLNEILGSSSLEEGSFSQEWQEVFGENEPASNNRADVQPEEESAFFLPSKLLDQDMNDLQSTVSGWPTAVPQNTSENTAGQISSRPTARDQSSKDLSAWFNLFADLDPLSNPDAIGRTDEERELLNA
ncbi:Islet cell autoantigen 1 69 kDa islet cell autoantigen [Triplophysa tibetana]|uniref:Islet cell autoantigen 1 69 kDa islet cell autoantigen n=1 Tax=Triplophysa tibetana TaxID=1572043 RepID=A0A5A9N0W7_9TELE|nr:Islet cell autoantigen 1 69 kDa islet cell autoantigen [Triplophysa tibetana]